MIIEGIANAKKLASDLGKKCMQPLIPDTFYRTIFDMTLQPADIEGQFPVIINVTIIF